MWSLTPNASWITTTAPRASPSVLVNTTPVRGSADANPAAEELLGLRHDEILRRVGKDFEPIGRQDPRGLHEPKHIGLQRVVLANDFEFDPGSAEDLARHLGRRHRLLHRVAAGRVGKHAHAQIANDGPEALPRALAARFAPQRYGHDLGTGGFHRFDQDGGRGITGRPQE